MNLSRRFAGASGAVFVLLSVTIAVIAPPIPSLATSGPDVVAYFAKNQDSFLIGNYLGALGLLPGIIVILYLIVAIRDAEPERGFIWLLALVTNTSGLAAAVAVFALLQGAAVVAPSSPPQLALALMDAGNMGFGLFFIPQAAGVASLAWGFLRTGTMPRAIAWAGVPIAAIMLVASFGTVVRTEPMAAGGVATVVAFGVFVLWFLAISVVLLVRPEPKAAA
jgi:hypothetical protein